MTNALSHELSCIRSHSGSSVSIIDPDGRSVSYDDLNLLVSDYKEKLMRLGVDSGMSVAIWCPKSSDVVAAIISLVRLDCVYVPLDYESPIERIVHMIKVSGSRIVLTLPRNSEILISYLRGTKSNLGAFSAFMLEEKGRAYPGCRYILFTSGTTGQPKGVLFNDENVLCFVRWAVKAFHLSDADTVGCIAPFHFDLSILDLYGALLSGATIRLFNESQVRNPRLMVEAIKQDGISMLYSTPSFYTLLTRFGRPSHDQMKSLRLVLFAGEVFPIPSLRLLRSLVPKAKLFNLYGPTETNVVSFKEIPLDIPGDRTKPYAIGDACSFARLARECGNSISEFPNGEEGELLIGGSSVCQGYVSNVKGESGDFVEKDGKKWYRSGDQVSREQDGDYYFIGRRDRMVKRGGYRIELKEIEVALLNNPIIKEAAVLVNKDQDRPVILGIITILDGEDGDIGSVRQFLLNQIPKYMFPDRFIIRDSLPVNSSFKVDYQKLQAEYFA